MEIFRKRREVIPVLVFLVFISFVYIAYIAMEGNKLAGKNSISEAQKERGQNASGQNNAKDGTDNKAEDEGGENQKAGSKEYGDDIWTLYVSDSLKVSMNLPKKVYEHGVGMTDLKGIENESDKSITLIYGSESSERTLYLADGIKSNEDLSRFIHDMAKKEGRGDGCRAGKQAAWAYQDGVYNVEMDGEDWGSEVDLGSTTCSWGSSNQVLYYPNKERAMYITWGQEAVFYADAEYAVSYDEDMMKSFRFR